MKIPKYVEKILDRRRYYGKMLNDYHSRILNFCNDNNIDTSDLESEYGCLYVTEPDRCYEQWRARIESKE